MKGQPRILEDPAFEAKLKWGVEINSNGGCSMESCLVNSTDFSHPLADLLCFKAACDTDFLRLQHFRPLLAGLWRRDLA